MKRVLVTGGLGFIGSHTTVELLEKGYEVFIVDSLFNSQIDVLDGIEEITSKKPHFEKLDLTDKSKLNDFLNKNEVDSIIHFAAFKAVGESVEKPLEYYKNNLISLINLLEACKNLSINKFVFSSSCTVYGQPKELPVDESFPKVPAASPYGNTKQICEEIIEDFCKSNEQFNAVSLRYFNPIGAHASSLIGELPLGVPNNLVPYITQTGVGMREQLNVYGGDYNTIDGTCIRDYIHVVDLAQAHISALEYTGEMGENYDFFNIGTGEGYSVLEVIKAFEKVSGSKLNYKIVDRRPGDVEKIYASTEKVNKILGWKSARNLEEMMKNAWDWQNSLMKS